ncbi:MAG: hypothetical protein IT363_13535 [Methanoregulaceae archaeon]|nr:hypothetical protein [Methanoregulaceae archaeon]
MGPRRKLAVFALAGSGLGTVLAWGVLKYTTRAPYPFMAGSDLVFVQLNPTDSTEAWLFYASEDQAAQVIKDAGLDFGPSDGQDSIAILQRVEPGAYTSTMRGPDGEPREVYLLKSAATFRTGPLQVEISDRPFLDLHDAGIMGRVPEWPKGQVMIAIRRPALTVDRFHSGLFSLRHPGLPTTAASMFSSRQIQMAESMSRAGYSIAERTAEHVARAKSDPQYRMETYITGLKASCIPFLRRR